MGKNIPRRTVGPVGRPTVARGVRYRPSWDTIICRGFSRGCPVGIHEKTKDDVTYSEIEKYITG